jgi:hypothetical protein
LQNTSFPPKIQPFVMEISEFGMVEIVESDMDVVELNKFDLNVFIVGKIVYCIEMELLPVLIGIFPSHKELLGYNHKHLDRCKRALSESLIRVKYRKDKSVDRKSRQLLKQPVNCVPLKLISTYLDTTKILGTSEDEIAKINVLLKRLYHIEAGQQQDHESSDFRLYQGQMTQASLKKGMDRVC